MLIIEFWESVPEKFTFNDGLFPYEGDNRLYFMMCGHIVMIDTFQLSQLSVII